MVIYWRLDITWEHYCGKYASGPNLCPVANASVLSCRIIGRSSYEATHRSGSTPASWCFVHINMCHYTESHLLNPHGYFNWLTYSLSDISKNISSKQIIMLVHSPITNEGISTYISVWWCNPSKVQDHLDPWNMNLFIALIVAQMRQSESLKVFNGSFCKMFDKMWRNT